MPYTATVLPLRGHVPSGYSVTSVDDTTLRSSTLATHDDGSAAVVVVAGEISVQANANRSISLQASQISDTALTAATVDQLLDNITINFGGTYGTASLTTFSSPERIWWANSRVICARYRMAAPTPGGTALEAVIDVQAFASTNRALIEIVVENGKVNAASASPAKPAAASYSGASVSVNGVALASVSSSGPANAEGNHAAFRAWYARGWVGGDPGMRATQTVADLQKHPLLFKCDQPGTSDLSIYASDTYSPWSTGRQRASGMGAAGDHPSIGPLPQWEARALQTGDARAWNATEVSTLACLSFNINHRDSVSGLVPSFSQIGAKSQQSTGWPSQTNGNDTAMWEVAHHPAAGLMAFVARPSPVFIELAQKIAIWNGTWSPSDTPGWTAGLHGYWYQVRGRAWCLRSLAHAIFLTPDGSSWKAPARTALANNVTYLDAWRTDGKFSLQYMCDQSVASPMDHEPGLAGFQQALWEHHYLAVEMHKAASARLLTGASQTAFNTITDWACMATVRWINEQPNGGWRYIPYKTTIGGDGTTIGSLSTWAAERNRAGNHSGSPAGVAGPWMSSGSTPTAYADYSTDGMAGAYYPSYFWAALVAARERGLAGADAAWATVQANVTNLTTWRAGFGSDPRWGSTPRN